MRDRWVGTQDGRPVFWQHYLFKLWGCRLNIHEMVDKDDPDCFHTHTAWAIRLILWGGYVEELEDGRHRTWFPGMIGIVSPSYCHRIVGLRNGRISYTLWFRFPNNYKVELRGSGWDRQEQMSRNS